MLVLDQEISIVAIYNNNHVYVIYKIIMLYK